MFLPFQLIEGSQYLIKVEVHIFISYGELNNDGWQFHQSKQIYTLMHPAQSEISESKEPDRNLKF